MIQLVEGENKGIGICKLTHLLFLEISWFIGYCENQSRVLMDMESVCG